MAEQHKTKWPFAAIILLASFSSTADSENIQFPTFNIKRECEYGANMVPYSYDEFDRCAASEASYIESIKRFWSSIPASVKISCIQKAQWYPAYKYGILYGCISANMMKPWQ